MNYNHQDVLKNEFTELRFSEVNCSIYQNNRELSKNQSQECCWHVVFLESLTDAGLWSGAVCGVLHESVGVNGERCVPDCDDDEGNEVHEKHACVGVDELRVEVFCYFSVKM